MNMNVWVQSRVSIYIYIYMCIHSLCFTYICIHHQRQEMVCHNTGQYSFQCFFFGRCFSAVWWWLPSLDFTINLLYVSKGQTWSVTLPNLTFFQDSFFHSAHPTGWAESISGNGVCVYVCMSVITSKKINYAAQSLHRLL